MINLVIFASIIASVFVMLSKRKVVLAGSVDDRSLSGGEKLAVFGLSFLGPIVNGAIFYYGWKKKMPRAAKQANKISWLAYVLIFLLAIGYYSWLASIGAL